MSPSVSLINLCFVSAAACFSLLALWSWRLRASQVGRSFFCFLVFADLWAIARTTVVSDALGPTFALPIALSFALAAAGMVFRVAELAANEAPGLSRRTEALIWLPLVAVVLIGDRAFGSLWVAGLLAGASFRFASVPLRSWRGFRTALYVASAAPLLVGGIVFAWLAGAPQGLVALSLPVATVVMAFALFYGLPRLGLLSADRVQHSRVIEAMSDGVLVVDLNDRLVDVNQAAREILELGEGATGSGLLRDALSGHPDLIELFSGAIDGRSLYTPEASRRRGDARTYDLQLSALHDGTGSIQNRVLVLRDISDRIEVERENRRQARDVRLVHQVSAAVHEAETIEAGLEAALALIARTLDFPLGQFLQSGSGGDSSQLVASGIVYNRVELDGPGDDEDDSQGALVLSSSSPEARSPEEVRSLDPRGTHWWRKLGLSPVLTLPVLIGPRLYGVFEFFAEDEVGVRDSMTEMLEHVGELVGRAVERKITEEKIRRLAFKDDLTGLPNRQRFQHLLRGAVALAARAKRRMALLFLDLDGFKKVNDTLGHEVGDRLLAEVASRFSRVVRVSDHVGRRNSEAPEAAISRLGGDEFTVLLTEINDPSGAALVADRLLATLERPIVLAGQDLFISTSIGIAVYPEDGVDAESLLRNADAAMYFAKGRGRNGYQFYSEEMNRTRASRIAIEARLRGALERDEFELHYQPIFDSESGEIVAAEALLRWSVEGAESVSPEEFIPVAEETGLIVTIGKWVFRTACAQAQRWREIHGASIRIGVNVSGHQIREAGMVEMVREALSETGVSPDQVELELTESTIMQDDSLTVHTLSELKSMGIGLALDDFGTGYSSLSYLRRFTIDRVKIDRSFVSELTENAADDALTSAIIAMAHGLRLKVVAEGVETPRQALFLRQRGCDELQGYLFGRPCPAEEFADLLRARPMRFDDLEDEKDEERPEG